MKSHKWVIDYRDFLEGKIMDNKNRNVKDILNYNNLKLETCHNYIQIMFPTDIQSEYNNIHPISPIQIEELKQSEVGIDNIHKMYEKMLKFWKLDGDNYKKWDKIFRHWNTTYNHNYQRMTRLLNCFKILELTDLFDDFSMRLKYIINEYKSGNPKIHLNDTTVEYWNSYIKPQGFILN